MKRYVSCMVVCIALASGAAFAQDSAGLNERLERLERDLNFVQKQVYRGSGSSADTSALATTPVPMNAGQLQVRLTQIDEEIRQIRGQLEQVQFQNRQTAEQMKKLAEDMDYRLRAIEQKQAESATTPPPAQTSNDEEGDADDASDDAAHKPNDPKPALTGRDFPNANAHYSHAFKLLNQRKFSEAATSFDAFVKKYPSDPLTSNAYYWLGESQYARNDFTRAADSFRKGYEVNHAGQKAPDNLYKLAMSLAQTKRVSEACIVLSQVISKYGETAARTTAKATEARTTYQCK